MVTCMPVRTRTKYRSVCAWVSHTFTLMSVCVCTLIFIHFTLLYTYKRACMCACSQDGDLYSTPDLLSCIAAGCVPCAYKMVVQPSLPQACQQLQFRANKRPEECLRMR